MSAVASSLYVAGETPVHRLRPQCKIAAVGAFVLAVVATPREQIWAFGLYGAGIIATAALARLRATLVLRRLVVELPFVAFALLLPFVAGGERFDIGWWSLSVDGTWGAWNILAKATICVGASVVLTATTPLADLVGGLDRLRFPKAVVAIVTFMVRYTEVIAAEMRRMSVARRSRGHDARWLWQAGAVARSAGALFVRSYERGERVHLAMLSRGFDGSLPTLAPAATRLDWMRAALVPTAALVVAAAAWTAQW